MQGGPLWMASEVTGRPLEDARKPDEKDLRVWNMVSLSGGVTGVLYLRYRPLLDGPLFGAFGPFAMDGSATPRSDMAGKLAKWTNANPELWKSRPVKGDIGIVFVPESERFNFAQQGNTSYYADIGQGRLRGFLRFQHSARLGTHRQHRRVSGRLPPLSRHAVAKDRCEASRLCRQWRHAHQRRLPGYFGDGAHAGAAQPDSGIARSLWRGGIRCRLYAGSARKSDVPPGRPHAWAAATSNRCIGPPAAKRSGDTQTAPSPPSRIISAKARTILIGTFPGAAYFKKPNAGSARRFCKSAAGISSTLRSAIP